jgi:hypothetical protein
VPPGALADNAQGGIAYPMGSATNFIVSAVFTGKAPVDPWGISGFKTPNDLRSAERTRHRVRRNRRIQINISAFISPPREVRYEPVMKTRLLA